MRVASLLFVATAVFVLTGCRGGGGETVSPKASAYSAPLSSVSAGHLVVEGGATSVVLHVSKNMSSLFQATSEGVPPKVTVGGGNVAVDLTSADVTKRRDVAITLNGSIPWDVSIRGGVARLDAALVGLELRSFALTGGLAHADLMLPMPKGTVPVALEGGVTNVAIDRPAGVPARLFIEGIGAAVTFDGQSHDVLGVRTEDKSAGYDAASDRYDISVKGAAAKLTVQ